jgi:phage protein, HK97 gp10 family
MGVDIDLFGMSELIEELELNVSNASKIENEALIAAAEPIINDAKQTTEFADRSGKLRGSLKVSKVKTKKDGKYVLAGAFDNDVYYAKMVEYGHSGKTAKAHPFLAPAFERHEKEALEIITNKLREALK